MPVSWTVRFAILAIACLAPPVDQDLNLGNISLLMTLAGVVAWRFMDRPAGRSRHHLGRSGRRWR